jgi:hypothetical protein
MNARGLALIESVHLASSKPQKIPVASPWPDRNYWMVTFTLVLAEIVGRAALGPGVAAVTVTM